jgi:tryptophan synthase alpha chain
LAFGSGKIPLAVGFGVSKPEHVKRLISAGADGVIVGSAFVNLIRANREIDVLLKELEAAASELKKATKNN